MEFSLNKQTIADPVKRFFFGLLMVVLCIVFMYGFGFYSDVTRENCLQVEATLDKCKSRSSQTSQDGFTYYLTFKDHDIDYSIHQSCDKGHLIEDLLKLPSGTEIRLLANEPTGTIYELEVNGEIWLAFDDAKAQIGNNMQLARYIIYVCFAVGAICILSSGVSLILKKCRRKE